MKNVKTRDFYSKAIIRNKEIYEKYETELSVLEFNKLNENQNSAVQISKQAVFSLRLNNLIAAYSKASANQNSKHSFRSVFE
jgi:hypothetical protein